MEITIKYLREKLASEDKYSSICNYWERGNKNELDIVTIDDLHNKVLIAEVKMNKDRFRPEIMKANAKNLVNKLKGYEIEYKSFSLEDI